jgi:hypothetical protein
LATLRVVSCQVGIARYMPLACMCMKLQHAAVAWPPRMQLAAAAVLLLTFMCVHKHAKCSSASNRAVVHLYVCAQACQMQPRCLPCWRCCCCCC